MTSTWRITLMSALCLLGVWAAVGSDPSSLGVSVAAVGVVALMVVMVQCSAVVRPEAATAIRRRSLANRDELVAEPAPAHPATAGRPRPRAPGETPRSR